MAIYLIIFKDSFRSFAYEVPRVESIFHEKNRLFIEGYFQSKIVLKN